MLLALLPIALVVFLVLVIVAILVSTFGSSEAIYKSFFVLPFDTTNYTITSSYGERIDPVNNTSSFHSGIDVVPTSPNIVAIADGTIIESNIDESHGEYIVVEHKVGGNLYRSWYLHLKENSRTVQAGDVVLQGQQIGIMGSTGKSTGDHLHFSLQKYNVQNQSFEYTDPSLVITNKITAKKYSLFDYETGKPNLPDNPNSGYIEDRFPNHNNTYKP